MSKRLQVLRLTVLERVRRTLREARTSQSVNERERKLKGTRRAAEYSFPTADLDQMLSEIERGYQA